MITSLAFLDEIRLVDVIEVLGTITFAISGVRLASAKKIDWFGAFVVGFVTAVGGGTVRDLLLSVTPFWLHNSLYLWCTIFAMVFVNLFRKYLVHLNNTFFWFDTFGLSLFVVVGVEKTLMLGYPAWVIIIMGTVTGVLGSVIRDILINEIPLVFTAELYAVACVIGGAVFCALDHMGVNITANEIITASTVVLIRVVATKYNIHLPALKGEEKDDGDNTRSQESLKR
ncbi:MAG: rane protein [Bacteroidetes bacterium]|nr:rane protein [Bacteroidota bacterium]